MSPIWTSLPLPRSAHRETREQLLAGISSMRSLHEDSEPIIRFILPSKSDTRPLSTQTSSMVVLRGVPDKPLEGHENSNPGQGGGQLDNNPWQIIAKKYRLHNYSNNIGRTESLEKAHHRGFMLFSPMAQMQSHSAEKPRLYMLSENARISNSATLIAPAFVAFFSRPLKHAPALLPASTSQPLKPRMHKL